MPVGTVSLTVVGPGNTPAGPSYDEQQSTAAGNSFDNGGGDIMLVVRNTHGTARTMTFVVDRYGAEQTVMTKSIPGSGTETGLAVLGPFPPSSFNDHSTTDSAKQGHVMFTHNGSNADLMICPVKVNRSLLSAG
jgi:hypothetical protein